MVTPFALAGEARRLPRRVTADARPNAPLSLDAPGPLCARAAPQQAEILAAGRGFS